MNKAVVVKFWDESVSCISVSKTQRGRHLSSNYFDVPDEEYGDGWIRGARIAQELLKEMRTTRLSRLQLVMEEASVHLVKRDGTTSGKRGAAAGLHTTIHDCISVAVSAMPLDAIAESIVIRSTASLERNNQAGRRRKLHLQSA
jgi:hypothetical protein